MRSGISAFMLICSCLPTAQQSERIHQAEASDDQVSDTLFTHFDAKTYDLGEKSPGTVLFGLHYDQERERGGAIYEVDAQGQVVWSYALTTEQNPEGSVLMDVSHTPQDTILFTVLHHGVFEVDRQGNELWSYPDSYASHDADKLEDGNVLVVHGNAPAGPPLVVELNPAGEVVWKWDGLETFGSEPYLGHVDELGGWAHPNAVHRSDDGHTHLSIRNFNTILELDPAGQVVSSLSFAAEAAEGVALASEGTVYGSRPHDPELSPDGRSYLVSLRNPRRVLEIDRESRRAFREWRSWTGYQGQLCIRDANRIAGGHIMIAVSDAIYELDERGELVWELRAPEGPLRGDDLDKRLYKVIHIDENRQAWGS